MSEYKKKRLNSFRSSHSGSSAAAKHTNMSKSVPNVSCTRQGTDATTNSGLAGGRSRTSPNLLQSKLVNRQPSYDHVRKIVQEEGRAARNLVTWNVPLDDQGKSQSKPVVVSVNALLDSPSHKRSQRSDSLPQRSNSESRPASSMSSPRALCKAQGSKQPSAKDLRARYWAFLFDNLRRAVDAIYQTCETDESVVECKEVIMMLNQCTKDFQSLIDKVELLRAYDNADENNRPTSLAWEIRKSSPGKSLSSSNHMLKESRMPSAAASRSLTFSSSSQHPNDSPTPRVPSSGNSWADRVKGVKPVSYANGDTLATEDQKLPELDDDFAPENQSAEMEEFEDSDGWETVQRTGKTRVRCTVQKDGVKMPLNHLVNCNLLARTTGPSPAEKAENSKLMLSVNVESLPFYDEPKTAASLKPLSSLMTPSCGESNVTVVAEERPVSQDGVAEEVPNEELTSDKSSTADKVADDAMCLSGISDSGNYLIGQHRDSCLHSDLLSQDVVGTSGETYISVDIGTVLGSSRRRHSDRGVLGLSSEDDADAEYDEEDDEAAVRDLDDALYNAMDEEDCLAHELEREQEAALESAILAEETWLQELAREQSREVQVDTEPDTEVEEMSLTGSCSCSGKLNSSLQSSLDWNTLVNQYDEEVRSRRDVKWSDLVEEADSRTPGRVVHVHEKLSSPSRKRSVTDCKKHQEEKQTKAREQREKVLGDKAERLRQLAKKVEEVQLWKNELLMQRKMATERKLERAEQKRQMQLQLKVRKAHEEETKANEIAFINSLEAQNKRHDIMSKHQESEARLLDLQEERHRKHEEKAAKEAAVEERRRALETERQTRYQEMAERRRQRTSEFELRQQEKEKERAEAARAKEREREERLAALSKQQQAHIEELQKKIQQKQDETDKRHKEKLEAIQEKAFRMSILRHSTEDHNDAPKLVPYEKKKICTICNVMIPSEVYLLSHLRGKKHQQSMADSHTGRELSRQEIENFNLKHIADAPLDRPDPQSACDKERLRILRKRCKKLRLRLTQRGGDYEASLSGKPQTVESEHKTKLAKVCKDLQKYLKNHSTSSGPWPQNMVTSLDRTLGEISRLFDKRVHADQVALRVNSGLSSLCQLLDIVGQTTTDMLSVVPAKSLVHVCTVLRQACIDCYDNCQFMLLSSKICTIVDILSHHIAMMIPDNASSMALQVSSASNLFKLPHSPSASALMDLLAAILCTLATTEGEKKRSSSSSTADMLVCQTNDIISYIVSLGIMDKLSQYLGNIRSPVDSDSMAIVDFLQHSLALITSIIRLTACRPGDAFDKKKVNDPTHLIVTLKATQLVGIISLLYGMLLHTDAPARGETPPPPLPAHTIRVVRMAFAMLNNIATLDLPLLQSALGEEGTSLEFRHIGSYLLWYCNHHSEEHLLHEVILCIGYFCVLNLDNQMIIQSGQPPTVLQQLCSLPFQYFSDARLMSILFPSLVSCCFRVERNREILEQELSCALLANFIEERILDGQQQAGSKKVRSAAGDKDHDGRMLFAARFPQESWSDAHSYFTSTH